MEQFVTHGERSNAKAPFEDAQRPHGRKDPGFPSKRSILKNILRSAGGTILSSIICLCILYSSEMGSLEGNQGVMLFILAAIGIATLFAIVSLCALLTSVSFISSDKLLFTLVYFLPVFFAAFILSMMAYRFIGLGDKEISVLLIPVGSYVLLWTIFYFLVRKGNVAASE